MNKLKFFSLVIFWLISIIASILWTFENPDKIEIIKSSFKKNLKNDIKIVQNEETEFKVIEANAYDVIFKKVFSISEKTAFIENNSNINEPINFEKVNIYTQSGYKITNNKIDKIKLNDNFHLDNNGGIKTIFTISEKKFALLTSKTNDCYYVSIVDLISLNETFKTECLPGTLKNYDFNGLGSSFVIKNESVLISIGTPTNDSSVISELAQNDKSYYGKILEFKKKDLINEKLNPILFSKGHRTPQGMTVLKGKIFAVEHGPKGGDELNQILLNENYGWPVSSYGTRYFYDKNGKSYNLNHENNNFKEPLFAFVPSIGISSLNNCPTNLKNYYKKNCLIALSLYGNELREGKSLVIFLLNETMSKVDSIEKIYLGSSFPLRHFMTNSQNQLYEDKAGNIYVSVDKDGIYQISFSKFRL